MAQAQRTLLRSDRAERVRASHPDASGVVLELADRSSVVLAVTPDRRRARRVCGLARRLDAVSLVETELGWRATLSAVWHRIPHTVEVSLPAAVALILDGVPTTVVGGRR